MPEANTIWRRRVALMAVVGLVVAIPVTIAIRGGDDDDAEPATPGAPEVGVVEFDRDVGVELRLPKGWIRKRKGDHAVTFTSPDESVLIAVSAPGPAEDAAAIQDAAIDAVKSKYKGVKVADRVKGAKIGDRPAQSAAIQAQNPKTKEPIRILVSTAKGEDLAYLVEVFAAGAEPTRSLVEAQVLLNNMRLEG